MIVVPDLARECVVVASVSDGKDSTALILALREADVPARYVFADTRWEAPETYGGLSSTGPWPTSSRSITGMACQ